VLWSGCVSNFVIGHEILFAEPLIDHCDACGHELRAHEMMALFEGGDALERTNASHGVYLSARGDEIRLEKAPLCGSCSTALGMTALMQWDLEEEEG
jgi:hypothetical protein